jgi:cysteine-rich repeat protein
VCSQGVKFPSIPRDRVRYLLDLMSGSRIRHSALALLPFLALTSAPASAHAAEELALDTWDGSETFTSRGPGSSAGAQITIAGDAVTVSSIAVLADVSSGGGSLRFVIFSHPDHEVIHVSAPKFFPDDDMSWKQSNAIDVVLEPGTYDIGAIADVGVNWALDQSAASAGHYSSAATHPNFSDYESPSVEGHGTSDGAVRLYTRVPECGDGFVDVTEECDDGNDTDDDECTNACTLPSCGDGILHDDEECDDGNDTDDDGCTNACTLPSCGDGILQDGEECDDGNTKNGDGCALDCTVEQEDDGEGGGGGQGGDDRGGSDDGGEGGSKNGGSKNGGSGSGGSGKGGSKSDGSGSGGSSQSGSSADDDDDSGCSCSLKKREGARGLWALLGLGALAGARRWRR